MYALKLRHSHVVEALHPVRGPAVQAVYGTGTVEATVMLPIASRITARLAALNIDEGGAVKKGQLMAQFENEDLQSNLKQLEAQAQFTESDYQRKQKIFEKGFETKANVEQAHAAFYAANAAAAKAKAELGFLQLTAPEDGTVIKRDGEVGQLIPANQPVFWISCCAPLRITAEIDEEDIGEVKVGQSVLIRADASPGNIFHGKVQGITPKGDPVSRSYRVRVAFTEETPLRIGMTAETNIIIRQTDNAILVPNSAIVSGNKVWLVKGRQVTRKTIRIGAKGPEQTEVLHGLAETDLVLVKPDQKLKEGQELPSVIVKQAE